jgi:hypothetical protein
MDLPTHPHLLPRQRYRRNARLPEFTWARDAGYRNTDKAYFCTGDDRPRRDEGFYNQASTSNLPAKGSKRLSDHLQKSTTPARKDAAFASRDRTKSRPFGAPKTYTSSRHSTTTTRSSRRTTSGSRTSMPSQARTTRSRFKAGLVRQLMLATASWDRPVRNPNSQATPPSMATVSSRARR